MRLIFCLIFCLFCFFPVSFAQGNYPVSRDTFQETDMIWAEIVRFSQGLSDVIKDSMFEEQKENVILLQKDINGINLSLLTLITMIEIEFIHSEKGQDNPEVIYYISRYTESLYDIADIAQKKNDEIIAQTKDIVLSKLYKKAHGYINAVKRILARIDEELKIAFSEGEKTISFPVEDIAEPDQQVQDRPKETEEKDIIPEGSWSITRYNPKTGYISYYTRDGRFVGRKKKE